MKTVAGLARRPDKITARFGIKLEAKAGVFIDFADVEGQFRLPSTGRNPA
jgi:hypothetical protein